MKALSSLTCCRRPWIPAVNRSLLISRSPPSIGSRQLSYLAAESRNQLRNHTIQSAIVRKRWNSSSTPLAQGIGRPLPDKTTNQASDHVQGDHSPTSETQSIRRDEPAYEITFTCKPCKTRSKHRISKQGYHKGTILITCPDCKNRHLICDHLNIFRDQSTTIEDILKEKGEFIKRGTLGAEGDIELWDDGTTTDRSSTSQTNDETSSTSSSNRIEPPAS